MDLAACACEEVQTLGRLDEAGVKLLCALMAEETRRFVVLRPPGGWGRDEIEDLVSEFFIEKGQSLTADLVMIGVTSEVVGKMTRRWIRNFLIDRARGTPLGRPRPCPAEPVHLVQRARKCQHCRLRESGGGPTANGTCLIPC
jgi:hypothetical protein